MNIALICAAFTFAFACGAASALAKPPPKGSPDADLMAPFTDWFLEHHACCDVGDGRPVEARIKDGHWQAYVTKRQFENATEDHWVNIPDEKVLRDPNPTGMPILWWNYDTVFCFSPNSGV